MNKKAMDSTQLILILIAAITLVVLALILTPAGRYMLDSIGALPIW